jgi:predicted NBD/HSP70 family sugar kinase
VRDVVVAAGRELGSAIAWLVGVLNIERVVLVGLAAEFGEPWHAAVRETMERGALGRLASATTVEIGRLRDDGVVLGASALLMTRELGLSLGGQVAGEADPAADEADDLDAGRGAA